jgi:hypothetical protein
LHSEDRFGVHCIALLDCYFFVVFFDFAEGADRTVWSIKQCVCHDQCAHGPWNKANVWSLEHPDKCLQYMKQHLCISGKHAMTASEAQIEIQTKFTEIEFVVSTDTFEDRQWYREQVGKSTALESAAKKRKKAGGAGGGGKGGGKDGGNDDAAAGVDFNQQLQVAISRGLAPALRAALANLGHSDERDDLQLTYMPEPSVPSHAVGNRITVSTEVLKTLRENARRSEDALKSAMLTMVEGAKRVRSELQSAMQVRADIDDLINQSSSASGVLS